MPLRYRFSCDSPNSHGACPRQEFKALYTDPTQGRVLRDLDNVASEARKLGWKINATTGAALCPHHAMEVTA
jgi:hypothetical protein